MTEQEAGDHDTMVNGHTEMPGTDGLLTFPLLSL